MSSGSVIVHPMRPVIVAAILEILAMSKYKRAGS